MTHPFLSFSAITTAFPPLALPDYFQTGASPGVRRSSPPLLRRWRRQSGSITRLTESAGPYRRKCGSSSLTPRPFGTLKASRSVPACFETRPGPIMVCSLLLPSLGTCRQGTLRWSRAGTVMRRTRSWPMGLCRPLLLRTRSPSRLPRPGG
jgi:hypothetical protein